MTSKQFLIQLPFLVAIITGFIAKTSFGQDTLSPKQTIKEHLNVPFGTLVKMTVEIADGNELNDKGHEGSFLFRVKSIDSILLSTPVLIEFKDETGNFPDDDFKLYTYLYGKKTGSLSSKEIKQMKKKYVGRQFNIVAYETGTFTGVPDGYFKYQEVRQDYGFYFRNYLIVVADLTKKIE